MRNIVAETPGPRGGHECLLCLMHKCCEALAVVDAGTAALFLDMHEYEHEQAEHAESE